MCGWQLNPILIGVQRTNTQHPPTWLALRHLRGTPPCAQRVAEGALALCVAAGLALCVGGCARKERRSEWETEEGLDKRVYNIGHRTCLKGRRSGERGGQSSAIVLEKHGVFLHKHSDTPTHRRTHTHTHTLDSIACS
jgi:hypothetical protein